MSTIKNIYARQIIDSRGNPTIEADVTLNDESFGRAAVPSGASTGSREAVEKRDGDNSRYLGKGVNLAVKKVNSKLKKELVNQSTHQATIDKMMIDIDGTHNKSNLGANAILAVSMALSRAIATQNKQPLYSYFNNLFNHRTLSLPVPMVNILNGGAHADNSVDFQEFMVVPAGFSCFSDSLRCSAEVFHSLKKLLSAKGHHTAVGDEGGFAPNLSSNQEAVELVCQAVENAGYQLGDQVFLALDVASSEFYKDKRYHLSSENKQYTSEEFADELISWTKKFPIISIEDGLDESDWDGWKYLSNHLRKTVQLVGDDLFVTNPSILQKGIDQEIANSILIKVNQIGTITETVEAMQMAYNADYTCVVSHRSGETEDSLIADLAVASGSNQIKTGSLSRSDRTAKYNQLIRIEEQLGKQALFAGKKSFKHL